MVSVFDRWYKFLTIRSKCVQTFLKALLFFIEMDAYFLFNENIFRQCKGLSMGNRLSKILADVFVSENLNKTFDIFASEMIGFFSIFVDDIGVSAHRDHMN